MTERSKVYMGVRRRSGPGSAKTSVSVVEGGEARPLPLRLDLKEYAPGGFEWGYGNNGPAQLALAILADVTGSDDYALRYHHWFKLDVISRLPFGDWKLTEREIMAWIDEHHPLKTGN
ncbi:MAG: DUF6166 domain-containing protein [Chloroflexi bacterium]|nr:DUF6166 domain-containing protein [Chloroflexota bacterium]